MSVEFIYDLDCPNVAAARTNLMRALNQKGMPARWREWERSSPDTPNYAREFGSPAILINGRDVGGLAPNGAAACRIYQGAGGFSSGVPSVEQIANALTDSPRPAEAVQNARRLKQHLPLLPALMFALLPKVACPACWPAYIGVLSAIGLGFLARTEYLLPLTAVFLALVLAGLTFGARKRGSYGPLILGLGASAAVLSGKFALHSDFLFYTGLALLVGSSLWNTWPRKQSKTASGCQCAPAGNTPVQ